MKSWLARKKFRAWFICAGERMTIKNEFAKSLAPVIYKIRA